MVRVRFLSGLAIGLPLLAIIVFGGIAFNIVACGLIILALIEYRDLFRHASMPVYLIPAIIASILICIVVAYPLETEWVQAFFAMFTLGMLALTLNTFIRGNKAAFAGMMLTFGGIFYIGWLGSHIIALRQLDQGVYWTLTTILVTVAADTGAYFAGQRFGKNLLAPQISPKKTWEGYIGACIVAPIIGLLLMLLWNALGAELALLHGVVLGLLCGVLTPLGDLTISTFKRFVDVKDSSNLIPGHGGVLDRVDTQIIAAIIGYYYVTFFVL